LPVKDVKSNDYFNAVSQFKIAGLNFNSTNYHYCLLLPQQFFYGKKNLQQNLKINLYNFNSAKYVGRLLDINILLLTIEIN